MALYRLHILKRTAVSGTEAGLISIRKSVSDPIFDTRSDHTFLFTTIPDSSRSF
jgi:hypothetical protein